MDLKGEIDSSTIIMGDFNTPLISMDRLTGLKLSKETTALTQTLEQMDLIDIYRTFQPYTQRIHFCFHQNLEPSPELTMFYATKKASAHCLKSKLYHASSQAIME